MKITVWGCRGSLPTPGRDTVKYGGNTTCIEVRLDDNSVIILDAGSGIRALGRKLLIEQTLEIYLLLTHAHWDHLMGFPFFRPAYSSRFKIHVRGGPQAKGQLGRYLKRQMDAPYFPVPFEAMKAEFDFTYGDPKIKQIGSAQIIPIRLNHPNGGYGFKILEKNRAFVFLPDNELGGEHAGGLPPEAYAEFCRGADFMMHDAQYTADEYRLTRGWGHSTISAAVKLAMEAEVKRLGLFHHDPDHNDDEIDGFVIQGQDQIRHSNSSVECEGIQEGMEIVI